MAEKCIGALPVVEQDKVVGIFSERDFARNAVHMRRLSLKVPVKEMMTKKVRFVCPQNTMEECMAIMTEHRVRHLPILDHDRLLGIVTIGDAVKHVIQEQKLILQKVLESVEEGKKSLRMNVAFNVEQNILPLVDRLARSSSKESMTLQLLREHLKHVSTDYYRKIVSAKFNFSPTEISVVKLIKSGLREKEIADMLGISLSTVKKHKYSIRGKLGIRNSAGSILSHLNVLD